MPIAPVPAPSAPPQNILGGVGLRLLAMLCLTGMFAVVKLVDAAGVHLIESLFWRQAVILPVLLTWALTHDGISTFRTSRVAIHGRRAAMGLTGMALNFGAMIYLPMAEAATISLSVPIFAVIFAALFLGEPTGKVRWSAVVAGFVGVLIVLNPTSLLSNGFSGSHGAGTLIAIGGAIMTALVTIQIRDLGRTESALSIVFWFSLISLAPLGIAMPFFATAHSGQVWLLLAGLGLLGAAAQMSLTGALRLAPVAVVTPMDYTSLLWSIVAGWWFFGTLPADTTWIGAPIIIASGLFIAWREHRLHVGRTKVIIP